MILVSIKPYYYYLIAEGKKYLIAEGKKKIEVRKTALKNLPQDIAFYMSKDEKSFAKIPKEFQEKYREHFGKVGIRAVVDNMDVYAYDCCDGVDIDDDMLLETMIDREYINIYAKGKALYGWHISDMKIYDKPKELSEFWGRKNCLAADTVECWNCFAACREINGRHYQPLSRPPHSWQFVEELEK